ncbi:MAG: DUF2203 domain-containing protein [Planctomycetes bacterium]|nr:DUF2203 domain-containing protein [Planctomycetota bacterium]
MPNAPSRPKKTFSLDEANRTLPLVERIARDLVRVNAEAARVHEEAQAQARKGRRVRASEAEDRLEELGDQIGVLLEELQGLGCVCKDTAVGLVDFPARVGDRIVFLCWKLGEPEIRYWHEVDAGFAGRKSVLGAFR